jgi:signal transduction histidine kinase
MPPLKRWFLWPAWPVVHAIVAALVVAVLWHANYPGWRIAVIAALLFGNSVRQLIFGHMLLPVRAMREQPGTCAKRGTGFWLCGLMAQFVVVGLSGGLHSPLLLATMTPLSSILIAFGWSTESKYAVRIVFIAAVLLIFLPAQWFGPVVPEPYYSQLAALMLFAVAVLHSAYLVAVTRALNASHCEVDRARDQMGQAALARARELEQLSAQLSHELKNPLGAIKALVQLSKRDACDNESRERLRVAESEVDRMNTILQEYLSFSRPLEKLRREPLSLGALTDEVLDLLGAQASTTGVALGRKGEARLDADPRRLREALFNLVANALDATPRGGSVQVRISQRQAAVQVEVHDSGRGMPREVLERVGTPFFTTREQGTGLGVAMARAAFAQHGGSLEYASEEGRGTTATGTLPLVPERSAGGPPPAG